MKTARFASLIMLLWVAACSTTPTGRHQLMLVSPSQAIQASAQAYPEKLAPYARKGKIDNDPEQVRRVKRITGRLIAQAMQLYPQTRNWPWKVVVIDDPKVVNAWCMAGGQMAVYSGLLEKLHLTDDELAQVMAHEISHAIANHSAEQMSVALASQVGLAVLSATALRDNRYRTAALTGAALAATVAIELPFSRSAEAEADRMGMELAARAGYDPRAALSLWRKMAKVNSDQPPELLNTHPSHEHRLEALEALLPKVLPLYHPDEPHPVYTGL